MRKIVIQISIGGTSLHGRSLPSNMEAINIALASDLSRHYRRSGGESLSTRPRVKPTVFE